MELSKMLNRISQGYQSILKDNLTGIYVHGSIAFGCFNWSQSDIDFIVVVFDSLSHETKRALMDLTVRLNEQAPPKGLEMSVVLKKYSRAFCYPTPFELHFSNMHAQRYRRDPDAYCEQMRGEDKDLAAHFTVIRQVGIALCGAPIRDVFGDVPVECYLDSIMGDIRDAKSAICSDPVYVILNLCRVAAFQKEGRVLSKKQGGEWGMRNLKREYRPLIRLALGSYRTGEALRLGRGEANAFCDYMFAVLRGGGQSLR